ncbi:cyclin y isoform a [Anaeramoeba ignava]|uniref:Cyclin y isoform a n=1 Tax=Anaeramoeba ignava TaxID=1746090 RepID=A0A9Q0LXT2_ANAIG|nr:cyclin y isoform a [Anaeramoeba ignava]
MKEIEEEFSSNDFDSNDSDSSEKEIKYKKTKQLPILSFKSEENLSNLHKEPSQMLFKQIQKVSIIPSNVILKSNSTSSLFVDHTLISPIPKIIIEGISQALFFQIGKEENIKEEFEIFEEPINWRKKNPNLKELRTFIENIQSSAELPSEVLIISLIYIERLIKKTGIKLNKFNWRKIVLSSLLLSLKVWDDFSVWNIDWIEMFPEISIQEMNELEKKFLEFISYQVLVSGNTYAKYFFEIESLCYLLNRKDVIKPLDKDSQQEIEERAKNIPFIEENDPNLRGIRSFGSDSDFIFRKTFYPANIKKV